MWRHFRTIQGVSENAQDFSRPRLDIVALLIANKSAEKEEVIG